MKLRLWPRRSAVEPGFEQVVTPEPAQPPEPEPTPGPEHTAPLLVEPREPANALTRAGSHVEHELPIPGLPQDPPEKVSLALDEAKAAIRAAGGDVIQVGFLASAYKRHKDDDPNSAETAAAHERLCELIGTRLRDRKLLSPEGVFELLEAPTALRQD